MISLRVLSIAHTAVYVALVLITAISGRALWGYPQELQLTEEHQHRDVENLQNAVSLTAANLTLLGEEFASLSTVKTAFQSHTENSISGSHRIPEDLISLTQNDLEYIAMIGIDGEVMYAIARNPQESGTETVPFTESQLNELIRNYYSETEASHQSTPEVQETFELFQRQLLLTSSVPVFSGNEEHQRYLGRLVLGWRLYDGVIEEIARLLQLDVSLASHTAGRDRYAAPLYDDPETGVLPYRIRCLYSPQEIIAGCLRVEHNEQLIPEFFSPRLITGMLVLSLLPLGVLLITIVYVVRPAEAFADELETLSGEQQPVPMTGEDKLKEHEQIRQAYNRVVQLAQEQKDSLLRENQLDTVTGVPSRRTMEHLATETWANLTRHGGTAALITVDIDHFYAYANQYGHMVADKLLAKIAAELQVYTRQVGELLVRSGEKEFTLMVRSASETELDKLLRQIQDTITRMDEPHSASPFNQVTASIGACWLNAEPGKLKPDEPEQWATQTSEALYKAKEHGRNRFCVNIIGQKTGRYS